MAAAPKVAHAPHDYISCNDHLCPMNGLVFYIGLGLGLALAAGCAPFCPRCSPVRSPRAACWV